MFFSNGHFFFLLKENHTDKHVFFLKTEQIFYDTLQVSFLLFLLKPDTWKKIYVQTQGESFEILTKTFKYQQVSKSGYIT